MAGKKGMMRRSHQDDVRSKIAVGQITKRLSDHVSGEIELTATQIQAARILLDKTLPNLQATELTGKDGEAIAIAYSQKDSSVL